jgi:hypothetical protein
MPLCRYVVEDSAWATTIDWTKVQQSWSKPSFTPGVQWVPVVQPAPVPSDLPTRALQMPLSTVLNELRPVDVQLLSDGDYLYSFPKNFVGTVRVAPLPGAAAGSTLSLLSGEWLDKLPYPPPAPTPPPTPVGRCGSAGEKGALKLECPKGALIDSVVFASYGLPTGSCAAGFHTGSCGANTSTAVVERLCVGRTR